MYVVSGLYVVSGFSRTVTGPPEGGRYGQRTEGGHYGQMVSYFRGSASPSFCFST
jgi:hypothetical protein